ncbi:transglycosylase domain-containing protein [Bacillus sp. FJAT-44742]|uniref:transglycosylase domain-containing protein n=1 Tax=Bacillus sp. FJAT-44742 TaxID=2014005 RepID=UPI000C24DEA3|nr:transglycosylase domain-containing protein [Bacillus sp. FJAT-44742]
MRVATGYTVIFLFVAIFIVVFLHVIDEAKSIRPFPAVLAEEIDVTDVELMNISYMYDTNGDLISEIAGEEKRKYLPHDEIPIMFKHAFLATEDRHFYEHQGLDMSSVVRAFITNIQSQSIEQGASTITQQLARNLFLDHSQSYNRKLKEVLYAYQMEQEYSKEDILELYLNTIYFGNGVYGIETASEFYFDKPSQELAVNEIAFLTGIPANPTFYNPLTNFENTKQRQEWVLEKMTEYESISEEKKDSAIAAEVVLQVKDRVDQYPSYVTYIEYELKELIAENEGFTKRLNNAEGEERIEIERELQGRTMEWLRSGLKIETNLQPSIQDQVNHALSSHLGAQEAEGTAVVVDHQNHSIVAVSGGKNYKKYDFHRGFQAYRQPGSAIKPLLSFAPYIEEHGVSINSLVNGSRFCTQGYCPRNFGGASYGHVSLNHAFTHSINTAALRLAERTGLETAFSYLEPFSFSKVTEDDYSYPSVLGGLNQGVTPLELTRAYTTFSNNGIYTPPRGIHKVTDYDGNVLLEWPHKETKLWSTETNEKMRALLQNVIKEGTGRNASYESHLAGGKTGTTNSYHDLWFVGYNEAYTTGVWIGKDQPGSIQPLSSEGTHLAVWRSIMSQIQ